MQNDFSASSSPCPDIPHSLNLVSSQNCIEFRHCPPGFLPLKAHDSARLLPMLRTLTTNRDSISCVMIFCIERSESAHSIVGLIVEVNLFLLDSEIARLYLLSDLLYNSSCEQKSAWIYRSEVQARLPGLFVRLRSCYDSTSSEALRGRLSDRVHRVVCAWREWQIFDERYLKGLLFQYDDVRLNSLDYESLTLPDAPEIVEREMKAYGLYRLGDAERDFGLLEQFRMKILGQDLDIDGLSLSSQSSEENLDGESLDGEPFLAQDYPIIPPTAPSSSNSNKLSFEWKAPRSSNPTVFRNDAKSVAAISRVENLADLFVPDLNPVNPRRRSRTPPPRHNRGKRRSAR